MRPSVPGRPPRRESRRRRAPGPAGKLLWENALPGEIGRGTLQYVVLQLKLPVLRAQLSYATSATGRPEQTRSSARCRNSGGYGLGIATTSPSRSSHILPTNCSGEPGEHQRVREAGSRSLGRQQAYRPYECLPAADMTDSNGIEMGGSGCVHRDYRGGLDQSDRV